MLLRPQAVRSHNETLKPRPSTLYSSFHFILHNSNITHRVQRPDGTSWTTFRTRPPVLEHTEKACCALFRSACLEVIWRWLVTSLSSGVSAVGLRDFDFGTKPSVWLKRLPVTRQAWRSSGPPDPKIRPALLKEGIATIFFARKACLSGFASALSRSRAISTKL